MLLLFILVLLVIFLIPVYRKPLVLPNFITENEIDHIKNEASKNFKISTVSQNATVDEEVRKSDTAWLELSDPIIKRVVERCVSLTDRPFVNVEKLQVLRYGPGGFYKPHQDTFSDTIGNKRMYTVILALNDEYEGGETTFPNIKKSYKLSKGDALFFNTLDNYELMTSQALHGGMPVKTGEKWICNIWIHKYPYKG
jgi:prolyl 4-hydroxylase|tara:strand:+ start:718 stop:1308 length:591 start_codon:yes stop_codon:yes gene_type:complete